MITNKIISNLYKKHPEPLREVDTNILKMMNDKLKYQHSIDISSENIIINSIDIESPFHEIPIRNITGIEEFQDYIAIVLRNSILFINKTNKEIQVHINVTKPTIWERLKFFLRRV